MQNFDLEKENGRSMIEMLGVLAIIGVLSVGGIAGYSKAMHRYRINKAIEQITLIIGNMRAFFGRRNDYSGADCSNGSANKPISQLNGNGCPVIKKAKIVPDEMITLDDDGKIYKITGVFDRPVYLWLSPAIEYHIDTNVETCIDMLSYDWTTANVEKISFNCMYTTGPSTLPISLDAAVEKCEYMISKGCYEMMFYFKK